MGFLAEAGAIEIGRARSTHNYMFSYVPDTNRYYCVFVNEVGDGVIWESRNQGLVWQQIDNVGKVNTISVRGKYYCWTRGMSGAPHSVAVADTRTGNVIAENYPVSGTWLGGLAIPMPELSPLTVQIPVQETFGSQRYFHMLGKQTIFGRVPGDRMFAIWGTEGVPGGMDIGAINCVWEYVDRFYEVIRYACWARWTGEGWQIEYYPSNPSGGPYAHRFENDIHGSGYEGFMNGRAGWEGVGKQEGNPSPAFFMPADHWQGNLNNSAPLWIPNMTSTQTNLKFPVSSTPSGLTGDSGSSRGAVMGFVGGRRTIGMIEPGYGFAHCVADGYSTTYIEPDLTEGTTSSSSTDDRTTRFQGHFSNRKFIGNLGLSFSRTVMWMPYSSGIFGMGVGAYLGGDYQTQRMMWIYDTKPNLIPTSVQVENGVYTDRDDKQAPQAKRGDSAYYRW